MWRKKNAERRRRRKQRRRCIRKREEPLCASERNARSNSDAHELVKNRLTLARDVREGSDLFESEMYIGVGGEGESGLAWKIRAGRVCFGSGFVGSLYRSIGRFDSLSLLRLGYISNAGYSE